MVREAHGVTNEVRVFSTLCISVMLKQQQAETRTHVPSDRGCSPDSSVGSNLDEILQIKCQQSRSAFWQAPASPFEMGCGRYWPTTSLSPVLIQTMPPSMLTHSLSLVTLPKLSFSALPYPASSPPSTELAETFLRLLLPLP
jgi:hypothetical protein